MSRTVITISCKEPERANQIISNILRRNNYKNIAENNENVWKCGKGFWTAMKYIKTEFSSDNMLYISGWIRPMGGSEQDLKGIVGALPKKQVLKTIQEIQSSLK